MINNFIMSLQKLPNELIDIIINEITDIITIARLNRCSKIFTLNRIKKDLLLILISTTDITKFWNIKHKKWIHLFGKLTILPYPECAFEGINENSKFIMIDSIIKNDFISMNFVLHLSLCFDVLQISKFYSIMDKYIYK